MINGSYDLFINQYENMTFYDLYCIEMYLMGCRQNLHSNQDNQTNIESYHATLKQWIKIDNHQLHGRRLDFLVWRLTIPVVTHYIYNHGKKLNGFVLNKRVEKIVANDIIKMKTIPLKHIRHHEAFIEGC